MSQARLPSGARLDLLVLWTVGVLHSHPEWKDDLVTTNHIADLVANKQAIDPASPLDYGELAAVRRSLERLQNAYLVEFDTTDGYRLGAEVE